MGKQRQRLTSPWRGQPPYEEEEVYSRASSLFVFVLSFAKRLFSSSRHVR
jgi:hypothetical protein